MMSKWLLLVATAGWLATVSAARADVIDSAFLQGSYTATVTGNSALNPTINDNGGAFLASPFQGTLTVGTPVTTTFLQVSPVAGGPNIGTLTGSVAIDMSLLGPNGSAITGLTTSAGGNAAKLSNGSIDFLANYELFYGNQTDCLTWNASSCTPTGNKTTVGEMLGVTFADNAVLDIYLYNWSDWDMAPSIGFELVSGPSATVPEPASVAVFCAGLVGLSLMLRRKGGGTRAQA